MAIAAVGQICSTASMEHNLDQCVKLMEQAAAKGAEVRDGHFFITSPDTSSSLLGRDRFLYLCQVTEQAWGSFLRRSYRVIFFPEASDYIASSPIESLSLAKPESESPFVLGLQAAARQHKLHVHVGIHVPVTSPPSPDATSTDRKLLNRTIWILPTGALEPSGSYDKLHLFDYGALRESAHTQAGTRLTPPFSSPIGRIGSLICFDLRFPEPALALAHPENGEPAQVLLYPSAFTVPTGTAHWEPLLRARAIEAQCWVIAAAQVGWHSGEAGKGRVSYGRSMVVDPWGKVRVALPVVREEDMVMEEGAVGALGLVEVDLEEWQRVRERMPLVRRM